MRNSIFHRVRLKPGQARAVADRRLEDAQCLIDSGLRRHANGAMYLAGYVVECLLKAALLEKRPELGTPNPQGLSRADARRWDLIHRRHELDLLLAELPDLRRRIREMTQGGGGALDHTLDEVCATWTVFARYSPYHAEMREATEFVVRIRELKRWLR